MKKKTLILLIVGIVTIGCIDSLCILGVNYNQYFNDSLHKSAKTFREADGSLESLIKLLHK